MDCAAFKFFLIILIFLLNFGGGLFIIVLFKNNKYFIYLGSLLMILSVIICTCLYSVFFDKVTFCLLKKNEHLGKNIINDEFFEELEEKNGNELAFSRDREN